MYRIALSFLIHNVFRITLKIKFTFTKGLDFKAKPYNNKTKNIFTRYMLSF